MENSGVGPPKCPHPSPTNKEGVLWTRTGSSVNPSTVGTGCDAGCTRTRDGRVTVVRTGAESVRE